MTHKMLNFQLHSLEEASKKQQWSSADPVTGEKLGQLEKEMKEQETLIQGYHVVSLFLCHALGTGNKHMYIMI